MTCVVAWAENEKVYMGADSAGVGGFYNIRTRLDEKVFVKDDMVFGFTSSFRMGQLIRYKLAIPEQSSRKTDYDYMCSDFIDAVIACFESAGYGRKENNVASGGFFLVGYKGKIYQVQCDYQVGLSAESYEAIGCGEEYALGALMAMEKSIYENPTEKIKVALKVAEHFSAGVRGPFNFAEI